MARGIRDALLLSDDECVNRWQKCNEYIRIFTSEHWASTFVQEMQAPHRASSSSHIMKPVGLSADEGVAKDILQSFAPISDSIGRRSAIVVSEIRE